MAIGVDQIYLSMTNPDTGAYLSALNSLVEENPDNAFYAQLLEEYNAAN